MGSDRRKGKSSCHLRFEVKRAPLDKASPVGLLNIFVLGERCPQKHFWTKLLSYCPSASKFEPHEAMNPQLSHLVSILGFNSHVLATGIRKYTKHALRIHLCLAGYLLKSPSKLLLVIDT